MRLFLIQMNSTVGDFDVNTRKILDGMKRAREAGCDLVLTPEMALCGYPPGDFLLSHGFIEEAQKKLEEIIAASGSLRVIVGIPRYHEHKKGRGLYNSAAVIDNGSLLGFQDKALLLTHDVFAESRYFDPAPCAQVWSVLGKNIGIVICEDIWQQNGQIQLAHYQYDPIQAFQGTQLDVLINLSASPFSQGKLEERIAVCGQAANMLNCPVVLCNQVGGNDSLIFDGYSFTIDQNKTLLGLAKGFEEDGLVVDLDKHPQQIVFKKDRISEMYSALVLGLSDYVRKSGFSQVLLGLSGGIDSALVACLAVEAVGAENVLALCMPSRYSSQSSGVDAKQLADNLGIERWDIPIEGPFQSYLDLLNPFFAGSSLGVTEENIQARIRGMILMATSNQKGRIVLSTGNKSESAMGYATLYGDMCGGLAVIGDVTKQDVYALARWINREHTVIPKNIIEKAPSAELRPNQKDSDTLPDYQIIDEVLKDYVEGRLTILEIVERRGYSREIVEDIIKRIYANEYKRRQSAPGLRISERSFSVGYHFPIVQRFSDRITCERR